MRLLKLGGSVITKKEERETANYQNIQKLAKMLGELWTSGVQDIVLVHGAGSFGHALVLEYELDEGAEDIIAKERVIQVQDACERLSNIFIAEINKNRIDTVQIKSHEVIKSDNKRIVKFDKRRIFDALKEKKMPVLYGDMVEDLSLGFSVCSGDQIISKLAEDAEFTVLGSNVDGIMVEGKIVEFITKDNFLHVEEHLNESGAPDVTGGMAQKIFELKQVGGKFYIANALYPERIENLMKKEKAICTTIEF